MLIIKYAIYFIIEAHIYKIYIINYAHIII